MERVDAEKLIQKLKKPAKSTKALRARTTLINKIASIVEAVKNYMGGQEKEYRLITDKTTLLRYVTHCINAGIASIDTETTSLDPMTAKLVGFSLFTPGQPPVYIPVNHVTIDGERLEGQLDEADVHDCLELLAENGTKLIFFNAQFDIRILRHTTGTYLSPYYDGYIAARLMNENEQSFGLKALHTKYIGHGEDESLSYSQLFDKIDFRYVPIEEAYLYAAKDAKVTYELYEFQKDFLDPDNELCKEYDMTGCANIFWRLEMPLVIVICDMEDRGVKFDFEYQKKLAEEYKQELEEAKLNFSRVLWNYTTNEYSISSNAQLATLFYDDLKILSPVWDRKAEKWKRPVDEPTLSECNHPLANLILEYRKCAKLLSTYVEKMAVLAENDGRLHGEYNQVGTVTGRFSSSNPNLQNIPSHNTKIRKMFVASDGYIMIGADFSAQEPRMAAHMSNDSRMIKAYQDGKDLYCEIASIAFKVPYEDCKEFNPDGSKNPQGKERRSKAKAIVLGICYGKGVRAIAEDLHITKEEAQEIYDTVLKEFPGLKNFMEESINMARTKGYVTTIFGRKRRLPDINLPRYEFSLRGGSKISPNAKRKLTDTLDRLWFDKRQKKIEELRKDGIIVRDNGGFIAKAERQCVNARIQGGAGDQIKVAMNKIAYDPELNRLGFKLLLQIHDELIGECPEENAKEAGARFQYLMEHAMDGILSVPSKCDIEYTKKWYGEAVEI